MSGKDDDIDGELPNVYNKAPRTRKISSLSLYGNTTAPEAHERRISRHKRISLFQDSDQNRKFQERSRKESVLNVRPLGSGRVSRVSVSSNGSEPLRKISRVAVLDTQFKIREDTKASAQRVRNLLFHNAPSDLEAQITGRNPLFCQMNVLCHFDDGEMGWIEQNRWLKYEEKVDEGNRWSKPHVSTTSLHALFEFHRSLTFREIVVLLDMEPEHCNHKTAERLAKELSDHYSLSYSVEKEIADILLTPHKHKHRGGAKFVDPEDAKKFSEIPNAIEAYPDGSKPSTLEAYTLNKKIEKKLSPPTETANFLVGQLDFLDKPIMLLARLARPIVMGDWAEVSRPTRFIFICLAPLRDYDRSEYEELGRSVASLFTDMIFREVAYKAASRQDLADGIDEFVDGLTVLPPSVWDPAIRLEPPEITMDGHKINKRLAVGSDRYTLSKDNMDLHGASHNDPTLRRTGRLFGGMWNDMKRRYPRYWSDVRDGFHLQCVAATIFLFFGCITPIVTFGGLLGHATDNYLGTMETMLAAAICGITFHLLAGQPLTIISATGPLLVFESILYQLCTQYEWDFLSFRFFVGMWVTIIMLLFVVFDLSSLVAYITRFTEESFSVLISLIFIVESFKKIDKVIQKHPIHIGVIRDPPHFTCHCVEPGNDTMATGVPLMNTTQTAMTYNSSLMSNLTSLPLMFEDFNYTEMAMDNCINAFGHIVVSHACLSKDDCLAHDWQLLGPACDSFKVISSDPDVGLFSMFLFLGTFMLAYTIRIFRTSPFFPSVVRNNVADFAVFIAILVFCGIDIYVGLDTPKLTVPNVVTPSRPDRGWVVDIAAVTHWWLILLALLPALLATILLFLDQQITAVIVNRKEHMLKKGCGYHLDLMVIAVLIFICSILGLPWFVAATVQSITHVRALLKQSEHRAPGEKPQFLGVREQRLTGVCIHILIGCSVMLTMVLKYVPMPVLYGVFLYMGVTSLFGVQFFDRILIIFKPLKYQPDFMFLRYVQIYRVHLFTLIQIVCMAIMWTVKSIEVISIAFPIMVLAISFVRKGMEWIFTTSELFWLDHLLPTKDDVADKDEEKKKPDAKDKDDAEIGYTNKAADLDGDDLIEEPIEEHSESDDMAGGEPPPRYSSSEV